MPIKMKGINYEINPNYSVFHIEEFSDDLKKIIRSQLSAVCHGNAKASKNRKQYQYKNTVKEFLDRYRKKVEDTKIGMIGELLTHMIIINYYEDFERVSPFFNMEEKSIKKGFDGVLYSPQNDELWIAEVKSGQLHKEKNADQTNRELIGTAKRDLKKRLNQNEMTLWENAINGALISIGRHSDYKDAVIDILEDISEENVEEECKSNDKNVILVSSLFANLDDRIQKSTQKKVHKSINKENTFKKVMVISLQKNTFTKVVDFFEEEIKK